ncbi:hypothetical protein CCAX7_45540 [Capsulimonas corticalis]|uniref:Uncharacterized protein n=1 Tax=Capsulimonas corticalis TaxID=2219043 RepID=A0A402D604_9BACT|nr:hypothetical protein CCAX7_45540 [Capsulimonas corticalis]
MLPDGYAEIIFHFGGACCILDNGELQPLPSPFLMGLLDQPVMLSTNRLDIIGVRCFPWTVFDLLGLPSSQDKVRIFEHPIVQLQSALNKQVRDGRIEDALDQLKEYFWNARSRIAIDSMLFDAGIAMREANGAMPIRQVAAAVHATVRTLERKFKQSSGYTVKDVSGLMRFEQVRNQLWLSPNSSIADVAYELGYTDQSHLSREFKRYAGVAPGAFVRKAREAKKL